MDRDNWFRMAARGVVRTRQVAGLINLVKPRMRLEVRSNFFSIIMVEDWNRVLEDITMACCVGHFK